jgi:hypothetical protein
VATDKVEIKLKCKACGGTVIELPDNPTDASIATCKSCGVAVGRWGDIKATAVDTVKAGIRADFKKAFKGLKGFNIK